MLEYLNASRDFSVDLDICERPSVGGGDAHGALVFVEADQARPGKKRKKGGRADAPKYRDLRCKDAVLRIRKFVDKVRGLPTLPCALLH